MAEITDSEQIPAQSHPTAIYFFFWGEFAERCSYYGMRAILPLYLATSLNLSEGYPVAIYFWFKMASYGLPLLGGYLADRWFGKYRTIVFFSVPYVLGHFILGIENWTAACIALVLLACGSGVIKPNISTLMGNTYDQQRPGQKQLRSAAFLYFYFAINVGALISTLALPKLRDWYGYAVAFQFPAWLMAISLAIFALGKPYYAKESPNLQAAPIKNSKEQKQVLARLFAFFGLMVLFWVPYEHNDSIWVFFARDYVDLRIPFLSQEFAPDQLQFINPLCVMIFAPLFGWLFPKLDPEGRTITATNKILVGFLIGAAASGVMTAAGYLASSENKVSMVWLVVAYVLLTISEVLVYGTGLELAFSAAPPQMKGFVTGCFLLTSTLANFFNSYFAQTYGGSLTSKPEERGFLSPGSFFGISGLFTVAAILVMLVMWKSFAVGFSNPPPSEAEALPNS